MSNGVNRAIIVGTVGRDPELRTTNSGTSVTTISIATNEKRKGEDVTTWHQVVCFGKTAEIACEYLAKGREVYVEGRMVHGQYEKDGQTHRKFEVIADRVVFLGRGNSGQQGNYHKPQEQSQGGNSGGWGGGQGQNQSGGWGNSGGGWGNQGGGPDPRMQF